MRGAHEDDALGRGNDISIALLGFVGDDECLFHYDTSKAVGNKDKRASSGLLLSAAFSGPSVEQQG